MTIEMEMEKTVEHAQYMEKWYSEPVRPHIQRKEIQNE
jgi:hypothetical protein